MTKLAYGILTVVLLIILAGCTVKSTDLPKPVASPKPTATIPTVLTMTSAPNRPDSPPVTYTPEPVKKPTIKYPDIWTTFSNTNLVTSLALQDGHLWLGTQGGALDYNLVDQTFTKYTISNSGLIGNFVRSVGSDDKGNIWFGTDNGISRFDGNRWTRYTTANGLVSNDIYALSLDSSGNVWAGSWGGGVSQYDGSKWTNYNTDSGLASNYIYSLCIDSSGNRWFGTDAGISKFDGTKWTTFNVTNGLASNVVSAIAVDDKGNLWLGTNAGVSVFDGVKWTNYNSKKGLADDKVHAKCVVWYGSWRK
jgi:ligand-binding sensor domain-containing protein